MRPDAPNPDDPFGGLGPQPVRCRWLSPDDEERAGTAAIVRLVVDDSRWRMHWPNAVYQRHAMREIGAFLGPTRALIVTPAGMLTTRHPDTTTIAAAPEALVGVDACVPGEATPRQSVIHTMSGAAVHKLYPAGEEAAKLEGWRAVQSAGAVPSSISARRITTSVGIVLTLVCNDACLFSARSRANLTDALKILVRDHLLASATEAPRPAFALLATHAQDGPRAGGIFKNAASVLAGEHGLTAVTTFFAPAHLLDSLAASFPVLGPRAGEVATLLVEDTRRMTGPA